MSSTKQRTQVASVEASPVAPAVPADPKAKAKENIERSLVLHGPPVMS
jgi:hypothetical protein